jgi:hypothetical protein
MATSNDQNDIATKLEALIVNTLDKKRGCSQILGIILDENFKRI